MAKKIRCVHCGNRTTAELLSQATTSETAISNSSTMDTLDFDVYYSLLKCNTCDAVSLVVNTEYDDNPSDLEEARLLYPERQAISTGVPKAIRKEYAEAEKIEKASPPAYAVMLGRALESLCKDQLAKGRTLKEQLEDLSTRDIIPRTLCEMGQTLRSLRNVGAHVTDYELDRDEVQTMKEFFLTMIEYVYVAPAKLDGLKKSIERKKSTMKKVSKS